MKEFAPHSPQSQSIQEFHKKAVRHLKVEEVFGKLNTLCNPACHESLIALVGSTGVGKSLLLEQFVAGVNRAYATSMDENPSMLPAVYLELPSPIAGDANWKDIIIRLLDKMSEPLIDKKTIPQFHINQSKKVISYSPRDVAEELRRALRHCVQYRDTKVIVLDEGRNLFYSRSSSRHSLQLDLVKSLANDVKIPIVIGSSYDLLNAENFHGQLITRTRTIHFERYTEEDLAQQNSYGISFRNTLYTLLNALPVEWSSDLLNHSDYFIRYSLGCVGILKRWLHRSLIESLKRSRPIDASLIERERLRLKDLQLIIEEAKLGEQLLEDISEEAFARNFGLSQIPSIRIATGKSSHEPIKQARGRRRIGARGPNRDKVGVDL